MQIAGFIIDPQQDFCDPSGALYVRGADKDLERLGKFVSDLGKHFSRLHVSMDAHHFVDIAHPAWWINGTGQHPEPFTIVTPDDVERGRWWTTHPDHQGRSLEYVRALSARGRYPLCIWPPHCLIGHPGQNIMPGLAHALDAWEAKTGRAVFYVPKGQNPFTEHYSAIRADVPDPADAATDTNRPLVESLRQADVIWVAGEAGSHCVPNTVRDLIAAWAEDSDAAAAQKLVLLTDTISPVSGFEHYQNDFFADMARLGVQTATTDTFRERFIL